MMYFTNGSYLKLEKKNSPRYGVVFKMAGMERTVRYSECKSDNTARLIGADSKLTAMIFISLLA